MVAGRLGALTRWRVLAVTEPGDEDHVMGGRGVLNQIEVRGWEDLNEITTFQRC